MYGGWHYTGSMFPGFGLGFIFTIIFWAIIIFLIVALVRMIVRRDGHFERDEDKRDTALQILKERYAKGEIKRDEFLKMKKDIE